VFRDGSESHYYATVLAPTQVRLCVCVLATGAGDDATVGEQVHGLPSVAPSLFGVTEKNQLSIWDVRSGPRRSESS
jgi:hypothetical protein